MQIESLAASYLMASGHPQVINTFGTEGIPGHRGLRAIVLLAQLGTLLWIWIAFARGAATRDRFIRFAAAGVCAFIAFGNVLSPQYLIWLVPLVALVRGARGVAVSVTFVAAFLCTDLWYGTQRYWDYVASGEWGWLVLTRNLILIVLLALLTLPARSRLPTLQARRSAKHHTGVEPPGADTIGVSSPPG